jgi:hypothetical protein
MSKATTIKVGLAGAAALLMLSACVSPDQGLEPRRSGGHWSGGLTLRTPE